MQSTYEDHRDAIYRIFDAAWTGLSSRIELARKFGWEWEQTTTPFLSFAGTQAVAHVGVLRVNLHLDGQDIPIAGIHAVCCLPEHRRKGHMREAMEAALAAIDERGQSALLTCGDPAIYEPFGFAKIHEHRALFARPDGPLASPAVQLDAQDPAQLEALHQRLRTRHPTSARFCVREPGWLFGICEVFSQRGLDRLHKLPDELGFAVYHIADETLELIDIIADEPLPLAQVVSHIPGPYKHIRVHFSADLMGTPTSLIPQEKDDVLMVRGPLGEFDFPQLTCLPSTARW